MSTLVVCIDGTWNHPGQIDLDPDSKEKIEINAKTNVARTWEALTGRTLDPKLPQSYGIIASLVAQPGAIAQPGEAIYLNGIGSIGNVVGRYIDGLTGRGISERICDAYRFLAERYVAGDEIFGFGFSRGAFAVRSLAGFLHSAGLPASKRLLGEEEVEKLYDRYRAGDSFANEPSGDVARPAPVRFLGLWDTVGALALDQDSHKISPPNVAQIKHALALDEVRRAFRPDYWDSSAAPTASVDEVWFSGVHSNVGGGYTVDDHSNIALFWVLAEANLAGLNINLRSVFGYDREIATQRLRESYAEVLERLGLFGNFIERLQLGREVRTIQTGQRVHASVFERMRESPGGSYVPLARLHNGQQFDPAQTQEAPWNAD